jgi:hypothetical protein
MTHKRLMRELGPGELAYWIAKNELDHNQYEQARRNAERKPKG